MPPLFDHEKLRVYQRAIAFIVWAEPLLTALPKTLPARDQLDRASTSIPLNIAEGNGKYTPADRCKYFDIARGSALECAACLDVLVAKARVPQEQIMDGKRTLVDVVSLLVGLIRSQDTTRVYEDAPVYGGKGEA